MKRPSALTDLIQELKRLPGIGQKTAERLSFFILRGEKMRADKLSTAITNVKEKIVLCTECHGITERNPCDICTDDKRDRSLICVVEEPYDVYVLENVGEFKGVYHVLMGVISPLDGIGPGELTLDALKTRVDTGAVKEIILATNPDLEGEATAIYIAKMFKENAVKLSRIARGVPVGGDIEYADTVTLQKALEGRTDMG
ncbi:MAG: recombination protein RecR [Candidatus Nitronauta litoralis]|uniref:Recombination protein RecR n=1 Tax=Candidatus Nitronauta litoralis TaxID=2705533 RepID=A0A7T0BUU9_9BACT|nr:MAG: recombination protein RecR [Candidatus Nitronauta litoralis]